MKKYKKLQDITAYQTASGLSDYVWEIVTRWNSFAKYTLGKQFVDAVDSIAGNIAEGFGRYYKKDKIRFFYQARGSVYESIHWCEKAFKRQLLTEEEKNHILGELDKLPKEIHYQIKLITINLTT